MVKALGEKKERKGSRVKEKETDLQEDTQHVRPNSWEGP